MSDGGFLKGEVPEPIIEPAHETSPPQEGSDVYAKAEQEARKQMERTQEDFLERDVALENGSGASVQTTDSTPTPPSTHQEDEVTREVESILQEGLQEYFNQMPPEAKQKFRAKGVEVSAEISSMMKRAQMKVKRVLTLIKAWLLTIPGVNKFFLEQEAKIKTDKIVAMHARHQEEMRNRV